MVTGVDLHRGTQTRAQCRQISLILQTDAHRHALYDLHPITDGILRGDNRKFRSGGGTETVDDARYFPIGIGIDLQLHLLTGVDLGQIGFIDIRLYP